MRYSTVPGPADLYTASCKYFHQAKTLYESLPNPTEEVRLILVVDGSLIITVSL